MTMLFLDTEFCPSTAPKLLSIALASGTGEFYAHLAGRSLRERLAGASTFVGDTVLPQLHLCPANMPDAACATEDEIGRRLAAWLDTFGGSPLQICFDYLEDANLLRAALRSAGALDRLSPTIQWVELAELADQPLCAEGMDASWSNSERVDRIYRHHALADARALRAAFEAGRTEAEAKGDIPTSHDFGIDPDEWAHFREALADDTARRRLEARRFARGAPICFLDIDDVVCLPNEFGGADAIAALDRDDDAAIDVFERLMHAPSVAALRAAHDALDGRVRYVISSTWRRYVTRGQMLQILGRSGLSFVANNLETGARWRTAHLPESTRLAELAFWLYANHLGEPFVVLDDQYSGWSMEEPAQAEDGPFAGRIVLCEMDVGLRTEHVPTVVRALRQAVVTRLFSTT